MTGNIGYYQPSIAGFKRQGTTGERQMNPQAKCDGNSKC